MNAMCAGVLGVTLAAGAAMAGPGDGAAHQRHPVALGRTLQPLWIEYQGVRYPATSGGADANVNVFDSITGINPASVFVDNTFPHKALDDFWFYPGPGAGAGRLLNQMTINVSTTPTVAAPTQNVEVEIEVFNTLNFGATPLNSGSAGMIRIGVAPPGGTWAVNTTFPVNVSLAGLPGGGITTTSDKGAVEFRYFLPAGSTTPNPDFTAGFNSDGAIAAGSGDDVVAFDDNLNGSYEPAELAIYNDPPPLTNSATFIMIMQSDVPAGATGACCTPDGSCQLLTKNACDGAGGRYQGNGTACGSSCPNAYTAASLPVVIPDGVGSNCGTAAVAEITVADSFTISSVDAAYFIPHTFQGDLHVTLTHVTTGTTVTLHNGPGAGNFSGDNLGVSTTVPFRASDLGAAVYDTAPNLAAGVTNAHGVFKPASPLAAFVGQNSAGVWRLSAQDCFTGDTGAINSFSLFLGKPAGCYPNCDNSTQPPVLNVGDFTCFLQKFAAADPYANCDNSTQPPVLNVGDFTCFLQKFAAGCA